MRRQKEAEARRGPREKAGEAGMELETRGCGGRSGWQPVCVDASAVTVRADWRSQSVSQSVGSAPAATHDRRPFFLPLLGGRIARISRIYTRTYLERERGRARERERERTIARNFASVSPLARASPISCSAQFFRLDFSFLSREPASKAVRGPVCQCASSDYRRNFPEIQKPASQPASRIDQVSLKGRKFFGLDYRV